MSEVDDAEREAANTGDDEDDDDNDEDDESDADDIVRVCACERGDKCSVGSALLYGVDSERVGVVSVSGVCVCEGDGERDVMGEGVVLVDGI